MNEPRAVLISGASSGIGRATALLLDQAGYRVFAGYRREADADSLRAEASDRLTPVRLDVTDPGQIAAAVALVSDETDQGRTFAAVVGNAGIHSVCPTAYIPIDRFRAVIEVNLIGHLGLIQACMPMLRRGRGRIASITSCNANLSVPYCAAYSAAKVGANYMLHALRRELRSFGIRVSIIEPGMIETPPWDDALETIDRNMADMDAATRTEFTETMARVQSIVLAMRPHAFRVQAVAEVVRKAIEARRPRRRYSVGRLSLLLRTVPLYPLWIQDLVTHLILEPPWRSRAASRDSDHR